MMREIKFRGKRKDNAEWIYGSYQADEMKFNKHTIIYSDNEGYYCEDEVIHESAGQYIGLKDKNGKDIYEGDIIKYYITGYETQEHFGDNIPNGYFCENVDTFIKYEIKEVKFRDGIFGVIDEQDNEITPLLWYVERSHTHVENDIYDDLIAYDYFKEYGFDSIESVKVALDGCEVIGNVYENPELLNQRE